MEFCFYPNHEYGCEHISHCPHLGGAALGTLVDAASEQGDFHEDLHGTIDAERKRNAELWEENKQLRQELEQVKLELKLERQNKFATNKQKQEDGQEQEENSESPDNNSNEPTPAEPKKRGAEQVPSRMFLTSPPQRSQRQQLELLRPKPSTRVAISTAMTKSYVFFGPRSVVQIRPVGHCVQVAQV